MTFTESVSTCFRKYVDFNGCASRSEFWWFSLFYALCYGACYAIGDMALLVFALIACLPSFAVAARRLHDTDRSGWLQLIALIPLIGAIFLIVWYCQDSRRPTRYLGGAPVLDQA